MILAAGLTPAWQQILSFDRFQPGEVNRANETLACASGKVLNVGMALHALDAPVQTLSILGGRAGDAIRQEFEERKIPARWIKSQTPTRTCTTILDEQTGETTELVENSAPLDELEIETYRQAFREEAAKAEIVVLSGSLPAGVKKSFYRDLMRDCPARVILDVRGEELNLALEERPFLVKPNREELGMTVGRELASESETLRKMRKLNQQGAAWVVVTSGANEVLVSQQSMSYRIVPPRLPVVNPIGCGDCFAAGLAWGFHQGLKSEDVLTLGVAAAADNLGRLLPARLDPQRVRKIAQTVRIESIHG